MAAAPGGAGLWAVCSGGWREGDGVAEGLELADVAALAAFGIDAGGVVTGAEVMEDGRPGQIAGAG